MCNAVMNIKKVLFEGALVSGDLKCGQSVSNALKLEAHSLRCQRSGGTLRLRVLLKLVLSSSEMTDVQMRVSCSHGSIL